MDTQDIAKFAVQALGVSETEKQAFPVVGTRAWSAEEIINLCERLSDRYAKVTRMPLAVLRTVQSFLRFFQWGWNVADRLAFTEVLASGKALNAEAMDEVYTIFGLDKQQNTTLEVYLQEYFSRIMNKLKQLDYEKAKSKKLKSKKNAFKESSKTNSQ
jgi:hypothetical protein